MSVILTPLGTGPGWPDAVLGGTSFLLESGGLRLLLDAGEPCARSLMAMGVELDSIDAVLISHGHSDHTGGLPLLIQGSWLHKRTRPLPIYLPGELIAPLRAWLDAVYLPESLAGFALEFHAWEQTTTVCYETGDQTLTVTVHPTTHLQSIRKLVSPDAMNRFLAYCFGFELGDLRLAWSADIGAPCDLEPLFAKPVSALLCEMAHYTPESLFGWLKERGEREDRKFQKLYLHHFAPNLRGHESDVIALGKRMLPDLAVIEAAVEGRAIELDSV